MEAPAVICYDFESKPIQQMPDYPPYPVGVSIRWPGESRSTYWAFGHPSHNNCDEAMARGELERAWKSGLPMLAHHQKFDYAVATEKWGLPKLPWYRLEDSMFLAYLYDPHSRAIGLKELAESLLNWPPEERDELADWVIGNQLSLLARYPTNNPIDKKTGRHKPTITKKLVPLWIWTAPGNIAGKYAEGDTDRTLALFKDLWPVIQEAGMGPAYDTERELMPILLQNELEGIRADVPALEADVVTYGAAMVTVETWLRKELRAGGLNFDRDDDTSAGLFE